ncbi:MAG: DNA-3-methyladenine glycosylase I [Alphaproteobacteria bacterium]|nr:DNA-3-methyladenine glycosylase I [Alphaproteobacteria bacterium]
MSGYCKIAPGHPLHGPYHDREYGFASRDETVLFERLCLEIMQAGLSWELVLKRRPTLNAAFADFDVDTVARFGARDVKRLMADPGIIRNRLKVDAVIDNAKRIQALRQSHGGFAQWLDAHEIFDGKPRDKAAWVKLFKQTFRFTGGEIVNEFLMSLGRLPGAHAPDCPVYKRLVKLQARSRANAKPKAAAGGASAPRRPARRAAAARSTARAR